MTISKIINNVENPIAQVIFAHGAGADKSHEFMEKMASLLNNAGINVLRFNFGYMDKRLDTGKKYPPERMPKLLDCFEQVIEDLVQDSSPNALSVNIPLFIGGKSMGSRVAVTLLGEESQLRESTRQLIKGAFCFGYPFHPDKKPEKLRLEPLFACQRPVLIMQGERDSLGSEVEIKDYQLPKYCKTHFFPDGDHSLKPRVKSGYTLEQHMTQAALSLRAFCLEHTANT